MNKNTFILFFFIASILGCKSDKKLKDLNLFFSTNLKIDSVFVSNITQDREFQFLPFSKELHIKLTDSINDLYNINFYTEKGLIMNQMWLDGSQVIIKGSISNKVNIDTVIGSELYIKSKTFRNNYKEIIEKNPNDSSKINSFLLDYTKNNVNNPLSIEISNQFFYRNIGTKKELKKIYSILAIQSNNLKSHLWNPFKKIENILLDNEIDFSKHRFYDLENKLTHISINNDKTYLIDFWFVNCPPCVKDHKIIAKKLNLLKQNNIELISISTDNDYKTWANYLNKNNYNWNNFKEIENYKDRITTEKLIKTFPTYLLIKNDTILKRSLSFSSMENFLKTP